MVCTDGTYTKCVQAISGGAHTNTLSISLTPSKYDPQKPRMTDVRTPHTNHKLLNSSSIKATPSSLANENIPQVSRFLNSNRRFVYALSLTS